MDSQKPSKGFPSAASTSPEFTEPAKVDTSPEISDAYSSSIPESRAKGALTAAPIRSPWPVSADKPAPPVRGQDPSNDKHRKVFAETVQGDALRWYQSLPNGTVRNFAELTRLFIEHNESYPARIREREKSRASEQPLLGEGEQSTQSKRIGPNFHQERPCAWMDFTLDASIGSPPCDLRKALVTHRISFNVLFLAAIIRLKLLNGNLRLRASSAELPDGTTVPTVGVITLPVQVGRHSEPVQYDVQFVVVEADSPYDAIFGSLVLDALDHDVSMSGRMTNKGSILRNALHGFDTPASKLPWISNDTALEPKPERQSTRKDRANLALIEEAEPQAPTNLQSVDASRKRKGQQQQSELLTQSRINRSQGLLGPSPQSYTPLNTSREHILSIICNSKVINWPRPLSLHRGDQSQFCHFHKGGGHRTEHCARLKEEIERLVQLGHLEAFRKETQKSATKDQPPGHGRPPY